ncbi:MAG: type VI secretion system lysozyme-like protein [Paraglaciecola sp.]|jgi:type VI secretion system lysozyme-like protein
MQRFLFDRLCHPLVKEPLGLQAKISKLRNSIEQELQRLVSNKSYFHGVDTQGPGDLTVLNFGIDNVLDFASNFADTYLISEQIVQAIRQFEPRLGSPQVTLISNHNTLAPASLRVTGTIMIDSLAQDFDTAIVLSTDE